MVEHLSPIKGPSPADRVKDATRKMMDSTKSRLTSLKSSVSDRFAKNEEEVNDPQGDIPVEHILDGPQESEISIDEQGPEVEEEEEVTENEDSHEMQIQELKVLLSDAVDVMQYQSERIKELQGSIDGMEAPSNDAIDSTTRNLSQNRPDTLGKDLNMTLNEGLTLMGISLLWLVALIGADQFVTLKEWMLGDVWPADLLTWSLGAGLWSFHILHRLHQAKTLLSMPMGMRIQTSIGVALAAGTALMLTAEEFGTVTNIWAYGSVFALLVLLISGFGGAFSRAFSRRFGKDDETENDETSNDSQSDES